jgi:hypothetical protein
MRLVRTVLFSLLVAAVSASPFPGDAGGVNHTNVGQGGGQNHDGVTAVGIKVASSKIPGKMDIIVTSEDVEFKAVGTTLRGVVQSRKDHRDALFAAIDAAATVVQDKTAELEADFTSTLEASAADLQIEISNLDKKIASKFEQFDENVEKWIKEVELEISTFEMDIQDGIEGAENDITTVLDKGIEAAETRIGQSSTAAQSDAAATSAAANKKIKDVEALLAGYASDNAIIWVGGTKQGSGFRGKRDLKMDRTNVDLSGDYFTHSTSFLTIKKAGVYRLNWWTNMEGRGCHAHARVRINNKCATGKNFNSFSPYYGNYWRDMHVDFTWVYKVGDKVNMQIESCSRGWNADKHSNFLSFQYMGQTKAKPRAQVVSC